MSHVEHAFIVKMKWKVNVIIQIIILSSIQVLILATLIATVISQVARLNICVSLTETLSRLKVPESCELEDEALLFISDVLPTAFWSVEHAGVKKGDTVIVLGSGPIGLMVQKFAWMKGASRVIVVDPLVYRLEHAKRTNNVEIFNFDEFDDIGSHLHEITHGGADVVIDCVGMDRKMKLFEKVEQKLKL